MLETVILLTCLEAQLIIGRVENNYDIPQVVRNEIIIEVLNVSECEDGNVR